jgi:hypothetical protein
MFTNGLMPGIPAYNIYKRADARYLLKFIDFGTVVNIAWISALQKR